MKRRLHERVLDRIWVEVCDLLQDASPVPRKLDGENSHTSISSSMDWPLACDALVKEVWTPHNFRRRKSVRQVVETLGIVDGRYFAQVLHHLEIPPAKLQRIREICEWGNPFMAPPFLLGWKWTCSPTSLRYLAHAFWLKQIGWIQQGGTIVEIGAGFGGLAAMNAILSDAKIHIVDLPEVTACVSVIMNVNGLSKSLVPFDETMRGNYTLISNYAFSELTTELQDQYFEKWIRSSKNGVMISNATQFARNISGRSNHEIVTCLRNFGFHVECHTEHPMLGPSDIMSCNVLIQWKK